MTICFRFSSVIFRRCSVVSWMSPSMTIFLATSSMSEVPKVFSMCSSETRSPLEESLKTSSIARRSSNLTSSPSRSFCAR